MKLSTRIVMGLALACAIVPVGNACASDSVVYECRWRQGRVGFHMRLDADTKGIKITMREGKKSVSGYIASDHAGDKEMYYRNDSTEIRWAMPFIYDSKLEVTIDRKTGASAMAIVSLVGGTSVPVKGGCKEQKS